MRIHLDDNSLAVIIHAVEALGWHRGLPCPLTDPAQRPDPGHALHLLQTLVLQADNYLPGLIAAAYDRGYTHHDIRGLLGLDTPLFSR
jgi:hypothetical protein